MAWLPKKSLQLFEKASSPCLESTAKQKAEPEEPAPNGSTEPKVPVTAYKSNTELRGVATGILLKALPQSIKYGQLKKDLPFHVKGINLMKKSGKLNAILTFTSPTECSAAYDALQTFTLEGQPVCFLGYFLVDDTKPPSR